MYLHVFINNRPVSSQPYDATPDSRLPTIAQACAFAQQACLEIKRPWLDSKRSSSIRRGLKRKGQAKASTEDYQFLKVVQPTGQV